MLAIDTLAYGAVTVPDAHLRFWSALISRAAARTPVEIVTFNKDAQIQMVKEQFGEDMAYSPTGDIIRELEEHFEKIKTLQKESKGLVSIDLTDYFPLHLFIFKKNRIAIFALQELFGDSTVRAHAVKTETPNLIDICRQSFIKLQWSAHMPKHEESF